MSCAFSTITERRASPNWSWICLQLVANDLGDARRRGEDIEQIGNLRHDLLVFADDLVRLQIGQALQLHFQNALRLDFGQVIAVGMQTEFGADVHRTRKLGIDARQHFLDHRRFPRAIQQARLGDHRGFRRLDQFDDLVDVGQRHRQTFQDMAAFARLAQIEHGAAGDDFAPVAQEGVEHFASG